jgi:signal peptidase II
MKSLLKVMAGSTVILVLDFLSKVWAHQSLQGEPSIELIPSFLYLTYHTNSGAAWGILQGQQLFFLVITLVALTIFGVWAWSADFKEKFIYSLAIVLLIGGTLGNFIDRVRFGYVIDFIDVYLGSYNFPIFNLADAALTVGVIAFSFDLIFLESKRVKSDA